MGFYINPQNCSKEDWLKANAVAKYLTPPQKHRDGDNVVVCLVDNGGFTAAGVAYDQTELETFALPDGRRKEWYMVPIAAVQKLINVEIK